MSVLKTPLGLFFVLVALAGTFLAMTGIGGSPGLIALIAYRDAIKPPAPYGIWAGALLFVYAVAFIFDIRDAIVWTRFALS